MKKQIFAFLLLGITNLQASNSLDDCGGSGGDGNWQFTSCVWSSSECKYSCPSGYQVIQSDPRCEWEMFDLGCYCWVDRESTED